MHRELKRGLCTTENTAPADHEVDVLLGLDLAAEHLLMRIARRQKLEVLEIAGERKTDHGSSDMASVPPQDPERPSRRQVPDEARRAGASQARRPPSRSARCGTRHRPSKEASGCRRGIPRPARGRRPHPCGRVVAADPGVLHAGDSELLERKDMLFWSRRSMAA